MGHRQRREKLRREKRKVGVSCCFLVFKNAQYESLEGIYATHCAKLIADDTTGKESCGNTIC